MLRFVREKLSGVGAPVLLGLLLPTGFAIAGTVDVNCDCYPGINAGDGVTYCECQESQGLSAFATNEYRRRCTYASWSHNYNPNDDSLPTPTAPTSLVSDIPSNVTCTVAAPAPSGDYIYNDCTNWNFSKRHVTIDTFCDQDPLQ
jgi:hypothetical protein